MITLLPGPTNGATASNSFAVNLAVGSEIPLGSTSDFLFAPELQLAIPLSTIVSQKFSDLYTIGYPTNNLRNPAYAAITMPSLWYIGLSVGLKFQIGGFPPPKKEEPQKRPSDK